MPGITSSRVPAMRPVRPAIDVEPEPPPLALFVPGIGRLRPRYRPQRNRRRHPHPFGPTASSGSSLSPAGEGGLHFRFRGELAGIRLPQPLTNVVSLPAVNIEISLNRFVNDVASISVKRGGNRIQRLFLPRFQSKADSLATQFATMIPCNTSQYEENWNYN